MDESQQKTQQESVVKSEATEDRSGTIKTIYQAGAGEIFWRNFLAGASRALGGILLYIIFLFLVGVVFLQIIWPRIQPLFDRLFNITESMQQMQQLQIPGNFQLPDNFPQINLQQ